VSQLPKKKQMTYPLAELQEIPGLDAELHALMKMDYNSRRRFIWKRRALWPERFLYRFRSLKRRELDAPGFSIFTDSSINALRTIIVDSHLRLSSPLDFNDPFDMAARISIEGTVEQRRERFSTLIKRLQPGMRRKEREAALSKLMEEDPDHQRARITQLYERDRATFGVCCFVAGNPREILMWSHYADEHTGICLQFECAKDLPIFSRAMHVDYIESYPVIRWITNLHQDLGRAFTQKDARWKHEMERRIVLDGQAHKFLAFEPAALTGIIFGCRAGDEVRAAVRDLLTERDAKGLPCVTLYRAKKRPEKYGLNFLKD
jgi:hypothetical protein